MDTEFLKDKMLGCLYGQAIGDALGLGSEFMSKDEVKKNYPNGLKNYDQIIQDAHRRRWAKGAWTDDTDMMLCILNGYDNEAFNLHRVASNFKDWFNGTPMGIGNHTYKVLCMADYVEQPEMCSKLWWELSRQQSAANGALMRTSVVGLAQTNIEVQAEAICKLTHYDPRCVGSCVIASSIINNLVWHDKQLSYDEIKNITQRYDERILEWVDAAYNSSEISCLIWMRHILLGTHCVHFRRRYGAIGTRSHLKMDCCRLSMKVVMPTQTEQLPVPYSVPNSVTLLSHLIISTIFIGKLSIIRL